MHNDAFIPVLIIAEEHVKLCSHALSKLWILEGLFKGSLFRQFSHFQYKVAWSCTCFSMSFETYDSVQSIIKNYLFFFSRKQTNDVISK